MITKFKLFESQYESNYDMPDLIDQLDESFIDEYFNSNYTIDFEDVNYGDFFVKYIDNEKFIKDHINDEINSREFGDFEDYDYKKYIESNYSDEKKEKILEIYLENYNDDDDVTEFEDYMLDELDNDEMMSVITVDNDSYDFIKYTVNDWHGDNETALDILTELYDVYSDEYGHKGEIDYEKVYKIVEKYVDVEKAVTDWIKTNDYDYKKEWVEEQIVWSTDLQFKLLEINDKNSLLLADIFIAEQTGTDISEEHKFQEKFIESYVEEHKDENDDIKKTYSDALEFVDDNFGLITTIEDLYDDNLYISSKKYNI